MLRFWQERACYDLKYVTINIKPYYSHVRIYFVFGDDWLRVMFFLGIDVAPL